MSLADAYIDEIDSGFNCQDHLIVKESPIEYFDGTFSAYCLKCDDRIQLERIPGGTLNTRAKSLLSVIKTNRVDQIHEIELNVLKAFLKEEIDSLKETSQVLMSVEEILCQT